MITHFPVIALDPVTLFTMVTPNLIDKMGHPLRLCTWTETNDAYFYIHH
jgi:hypothetical protein